MSELDENVDTFHDANKELERLLLDVLGNLPGTSITVFDRRLRVLLLTGSATAAAGLDPANATGRPLSELMAPSEFARLEAIYRATLSGESRIDEQSPLGAEGVWWLRTVPLRTTSGKVYAGLAVATDVTDRRVEELRRLRIDAQLERARRLEAVGKMAGGVAHDFNNLLAVVLNYTDFITDALPGDSELHQDLAEIRKAGERGASLTRQLLIFSRREVASPELIDLNDVMTNLEKLLYRTLGEDIVLTIQKGDGLYPIEADAGQIEQALVGMALNSREAMPEGGSMTIQTENVILDQEYVDANPEARVGPHVRVTVADTGQGIPPDLLERIFEPFFTTKARSTGTGLGLAAVHGVMANASGHITVYSEPGMGTVFRLHFPAGGPVGATSPEPGVAEPAGSISVPPGTRVLIAEDDDAVRQVATRVLESTGFEVVSCPDGQEAIEVLEAGERFALLITDVVMPRASGRELADRAREIDAWMPVLFMSGYTEDIISSHDLVTKDLSFLRKPFTARDLLEAVQLSLGLTPE
ncbi:MAG TPA: ATP-binding protein [Solirubrobacterales bacterium]|nr:ATP-binding protein [Solirubrobacterales bacterium]